MLVSLIIAPCSWPVSIPRFFLHYKKVLYIHIFFLIKQWLNTLLLLSFNSILSQLSHCIIRISPLVHQLPIWNGNKFRANYSPWTLHYEQIHSHNLDMTGQNLKYLHHLFSFPKWSFFSSSTMSFISKIFFSFFDH